MKTINHESDFKLLIGYSDGSPINEPFRLTFYTKVSRGTFIAEYNGSEYVNCYPDGGMVKLPFDKPMLGMGVLSVKIELFLSDADFTDGKYDYVSVEPTGIILDKGATEPFEDMEVLISKPNTRGLQMFLSKPYVGEGGGGGGEIPNGSITEYKLATGAVSTSKIKDGAVTMAKLSDEVKNKLNQGSGFSGDYNDLKNKPTIPTNVSQLTNDKGYITEIADGSITEEKLSEEVIAKLNQGGGGGMSEIPDGGVTTAKIADGAVTETKLGTDVATTLGMMKNKLDILYKVALTFAGGGNKKKGTSVNVTLSWTVKVNGTAVDPSSQTLNGEALDATLRTKTFTGVTTDTTYTLVVDGVTATQYVRFYNPAYFGVVSPDYQVSSDVSGLTEQTNYGTRTLNKTATASGSMKVVYLYPQSLGALTSIKDGNNFDVTGSFTKTTDITINGEKYIAYLLTQEANINGLTFKFA